MGTLLIVRVGNYVIVDILMINETLDAATPYSGALQTRERSRTRS